MSSVHLLSGLVTFAFILAVPGQGSLARPGKKRTPPPSLPAAAGTTLPAGGVRAAAPGDPVSPGGQPGDQMLAESMRLETRLLADRCLEDIRTAEDWNARKAEYRRQLAEMLGLWPAPERTPLKAVVTGKIEQPQFTVEKLYFQSRPGLYVSGTLCLPKGAAAPVPAILYVCGHGQAKIDGVAYGSKSIYQHHGEWFARHGFACLTIDTLELGEIEGEHHGIYRRGWWWWNCRGYTPGGVEAWNGIRALDYLQSRPEIDGRRLGVTGRSGGGAYSWFIAALDERVGAAVPVAGITDLENHVLDGCVEGHCDCMYVVNTYRWDYPQLAALVAPRALLIGNSDKDSIFPLDGVVRIYQKVRRIYRLLDAEKQLGLLITEGPHQDTQDLQLPAFRWFNRFLRREDPVIEVAATKLLTPQELKVWPKDGLPADQRNTRIHETFTGITPQAPVPEGGVEWAGLRDGWRAALRQKVFGGWPEAPGDLQLKEAFSSERSGIRLSAWDFNSQPGIRLRLFLMQRAGRAGRKPEMVVLNILDGEGWRHWLASARAGFAAELKDEGPGEPDPAAYAEIQKMLQSSGSPQGGSWAMAWVGPRGVGRAAWGGDDRKQVQIRRRFMLLGQTLTGMQIWDTRRAIQSLRSLSSLSGVPLWLQGERDMSVVALYAAVFEPDIARVDLWQLPRTHMEGPDLLNVLRILDVPQAVSLAAARSKVKIYQPADAGWDYPRAVGARLGWDPKQVEVRLVPAK